MTNDRRPTDYVASIRARGLSIYDPIAVGDPELWIPAQELEALLNAGLAGFGTAGLPPRTRSKLVKQRVCEVLGYPVPPSFRKTKPRFPGQAFDTYVQKANNLQIWNEELSASRRYVILRVTERDMIGRVKVVTGDRLALLDTTGTLTKKYQARVGASTAIAELASRTDSDRLAPLVSEDARFSSNTSPIKHPQPGELLSVNSIFNRLTAVVGKRFADPGLDQDRARGAVLHGLVCDALGYPVYHDGGQFPDVPHQLLEVKLQTASTIDLGLICPDSTEPLDVPMIDRRQIRHCDVRYAIFLAERAGDMIEITNLIVVTGDGFFRRFVQCQGRVLSAKLQIPLSRDFFER